MKAWRSKSFILLLVLAFVLSACSSGTKNAPAGTNGQTDPGANKEGNNAGSNSGNNVQGNDGAANNGSVDAPAVQFTDTDMSGSITFWTFSPEIHKEIAASFNKVYPKIKVNVVGLGWEVHDKLQTTLAAGKGAPDIAQVEQGQFPRYIKGDVLEDLLEAPYEAGKYKEDTTDYNWFRWMNQDNTKLLGIPWDVTPGVYYYRADIFEELGLPSEPEELGEYIADADNWITVVETLTSNGKFGMEWRDGPVHWAGDAVGYFDKDFNWLRNTEELVKILDVTKRQNQLKIAPHMGFGDEKGKALVKSGKLVGLVLGSWGAREIAKVFPDQKGKWRATSVPMGIYYGGGGSTFVIPKQAPDENKLAAWKFLEWMQFSEDAWKIFVKWSVQPGWKSIAEASWYQELTNEYLGGQADFALYSQLAEKLQPLKKTELDGKAWDIWLKGVLEALDKNVDSKTEINKIEDNIKRQLGPEIDKLKKAYNIE
ncbi:ABC transporter substrate-binding protein [Paenibacillus spongiae]|uniref:Extracellular solute-binding protein n=1 Tax=Paenibacillus spongiae TaxID=2909671 RepID=A0ABY5S8M8_9BACL|nr:extracellular solute-binding protein [Paenibacillus spongiae]UVI29155.1 extracellular solute-binding protein [Paenibacillus spongiae]